MKYIPGILIILLVALGCGERTQTSQEIHQHEDVANPAVIHLNNGKKWKADSTTIVGIRNMQISVEAYSKHKDPETLHQELQSELDLVFQRCTMKGDAHEQLHHYLLPLQEKISLLKKRKDPETIKDIRLHLEEFDRYFE